MQKNIILILVVAVFLGCANNEAQIDKRIKEERQKWELEKKLSEQKQQEKAKNDQQTLAQKQEQVKQDQVTRKVMEQKHSTEYSELVKTENILEEETYYPASTMSANICYPLILDPSCAMFVIKKPIFQQTTIKKTGLTLEESVKYKTDQKLFEEYCKLTGEIQNLTTTDARVSIKVKLYDADKNPLAEKDAVVSIAPGNQEIFSISFNPLTKESESTIKANYIKILLSY